MSATIYYANSDAGIASRANSAMLRIDAISSATHIPAGERLVMIAEIMAAEPILECNSPAAHRTRRARASRG